MTTEQPTQPIRRDAQGYARGVRCGLNHSGNHGLVELTRGYWQCQGCGAGYLAAELWAAKPGSIGEGGVIKTD